jgi:hypothetical protein
LLTAPTYSLATGPYDLDGMTATPSVTSTIIISGGVDGAIVERSGAGLYRLFHVGETGVLTLQEVTVRFGDADDNGGAIYSKGALTLTNSEIISNMARFGGGLYMRDSKVTLVNTGLISNSANYGGGIYNVGGAATITNSDFAGNAAEYGGGLYNTFQSAATISATRFVFNNADFGGAIRNGDRSKVTLTNSEIRANTAGSHGGGIYQWNNAGDGGTGSVTTITNSRILENKTGYLLGGGAFWIGGDVSVTHSCIVNNADLAFISEDYMSTDAANNWWGAANGPGGRRPGAGDSIENYIMVDPYLLEPILGCPVRGGNMLYLPHVEALPGSLEKGNLDISGSVPDGH